MELRSLITELNKRCKFTNEHGMELRISSSLVILPFFLFIFMILRILKMSKAKDRLASPALPPGPWKLPIIGNMHHLLGTFPHHRLGELAKKYGPVMQLQLGEICHIVISSAEAAEEVMKTHDANFVERPPFYLFADIIFYNRKDIMFGEYWRQMRKICAEELLSARRVKSFRSIREEEVLNLNKSISSSVGFDPINLSRMLFSLAYSITTRAAFGKLLKDEEMFIPLVEGIVQVSAAGNIADLFPSMKFLPRISGVKSRMERLHREVDRILESIITEHGARETTARSNDHQINRADDLVDVLLNLQHHGNLGFPFTTDNIKAVILDLFIGGTETSSSALEWAMSEMLKHPSVMEKAQAEVRQVFGIKGSVDESALGELNFMKMVIRETLRLHPPVPLLIPRACREQCEIGGYHIPTKSVVLVNAWAIGRESSHWNDAERFNPERFLNNEIDYKGAHFEFIPFGAGRRMCPGMSFGIASIELPLANLLYHFDWQLPSGMKPECLDMLESIGTTSRRKNALHVTPILRHPLPVG